MAPTRLDSSQTHFATGLEPYMPASTVALSLPPDGAETMAPILGLWEKVQQGVELDDAICLRAAGRSPWRGTAALLFEGPVAVSYVDLLPSFSEASGCASRVHFVLKGVEAQDVPRAKRHAGGASDGDMILDDPVFRPRSLRAFAERGFKATLKVPSLKGR